MDFIDKKIKEFYETLTDQVDEENEYYDSQFEGTQPKTVESFIRKMFKEYQESNSGGNVSYASPASLGVQAAGQDGDVFIIDNNEFVNIKNLPKDKYEKFLNTMHKVLSLYTTLKERRFGA
jgi:hypothetical protein